MLFLATLRLLLLIAAGILVLFTLLPLWDTPRWWVRGLDMPRVQFSIAGVVIVLLSVLLLSGGWRWSIGALVAACTVYQLAIVFPYLPVAKVQMRLAPADDAADFKLLVSNVLMDSARYEDVRSLIEREQPDILLLLETDEIWLRELEPVLESFATVVRQPQDNYYGLIFATNLPAESTEIAYLSPVEEPSVFAELKAPDSDRFNFIGLHPRPPQVGVDSAERDAQLVYAARYAYRNDAPVLLAGDLNAAAWSPISRRLREVGQFLDPRLGRGPLSSFSARSRILRLPIDQIYMSREIVLVDMRIGPDVGSDHFPVAATMRIDADAAERFNDPVPPPDPSAQTYIEEAVARHQERLIEAGVLPKSPEAAPDPEDGG